MAKRIKTRKVSLTPKVMPRAGVTKNPKQAYKCGGKVKTSK